MDPNPNPTFEYPRFIPGAIPVKKPSAPGAPKRFSLTLFISFLVTAGLSVLLLNSRLLFSLNQEALATYHIQTWLKPIVDVFRVLSDYTDFPLYALVILFFYWCVDWAIGLRVLTIGLFSIALNPFLKAVFQQPRPFKILEGTVQKLGGASGYGMPSGHAQSTSAVFGVTAEYSHKTWARILFLVIIFLVGLSRIVLGVHLPLQIIAAWTVSIAVILFFLQAEMLIMPWFRKHSIFVKIGLTFLFSTIFFLVIYYLMDRIHIEEFIRHERSLMSANGLREMLFRGGIFFGWLGSAVVVIQKFPKEVGIAWWRNAIRFLFGALLTGTMYIAIAYIATLDVFILTFVLATLLGAMIGGLLPWLFRRYF